MKNQWLVELIQQIDKLHIDFVEYCPKWDYYTVRYTDNKDRAWEARIGTEHPGDDFKLHHNVKIKEDIND